MTGNLPDEEHWKFATKQIHAGARLDGDYRARITPIYQSTSFVFPDAKTAADIFSLDNLDEFSYARGANPTNATVERRIASLEGGKRAIVVGSGQAATSLALLNLLRTGDHIVASNQLYGGSLTLFQQRFPELGIAVTVIDDINNPDAWRSAVRPETRVFFAESIANPLGRVLDIEAVADVAHEVGIPLVIDNTLATPYLLRPIDYGADIVVHSTTKFLAGHGRAVGGVIVDSGRFDFGAEPEKWPGFTEPVEEFGGRDFWTRFGDRGLAYSVRLRITVLRDFGPSASAFNSFLLLQGIETLSLRMRQHVENSYKVIDFLKDDPRVASVHYSGSAEGESDLVKKYLPRGGSSVFSFVHAGGYDAAARFVESLRIFSHLANIGDVRSLAIHPASTVQVGVSPEEREKAGVPDSLIRLSVGIEDADDLIADLDQALAASM